jgi:hypothetical protein
VSCVPYKINRKNVKVGCKDYLGEVDVGKKNIKYVLRMGYETMALAVLFEHDYEPAGIIKTWNILMG